MKKLNNMESVKKEGFKIERDGEIITLTPEEMDCFGYIKNALTGQKKFDSYLEYIKDCNYDISDDNLKALHKIRKDEEKCNILYENIMDIGEDAQEIVQGIIEDFIKDEANTRNMGDVLTPKPVQTTQVQTNENSDDPNNSDNTLCYKQELKRLHSFKTDWDTNKRKWWPQEYVDWHIKLLDESIEDILKIMNLKRADESISIEEMNDYGYHSNNIFPLRAKLTRQLFLEEENPYIDIYRLYSNNTEDTMNTLDEYEKHCKNNGLFGILKDDWVTYIRKKNQTKYEQRLEVATLKAIDIQWYTDDDTELLEYLPKEVIIPKGMTDEEEISDYLSDKTGFCHKGFNLIPIEREEK